MLKAVRTVRHGAILTVLLALVAFAIPCFVAAAAAIAMPMETTLGCSQTLGFETCPQQAVTLDHSLASLRGYDSHSAAVAQPTSLRLAAELRSAEFSAPFEESLDTGSSTPLRL